MVMSWLKAGEATQRRSSGEGGAPSGVSGYRAESALYDPASMCVESRPETSDQGVATAPDHQEASWHPPQSIVLSSHAWFRRVRRQLYRHLERLGMDPGAFRPGS